MLTSIFPEPDRTADRRAANAVHRLGTQLRATLATARILVEAGRTIDLTGAEDRIGEFCARALDLSPEYAPEMQTTLLAVRAELERTIATLDSHSPA